MGGRGSSSTSSRISGGGGGGAISVSLNDGTIADFDNDGVGTIDPATLNLTQSALMAMTDDEFADYIDSVKQADMPLFLAGWDTQRFIYSSNINGLPQVVDDKTFQSMKGTTMYRTVNSAYDAKTDVGMTAPQIAQQTMGGTLSRIGGGIYGDGYYFDVSKSGSASYGYTRGNKTKTCQMQAKLNDNAKVVSHSNLTRMFSNESSKVQRAVNGMSSGLHGGNLSVYALKKGYNVIDCGGGYFNVIDRSAMTMSSKITAI